MYGIPECPQKTNHQLHTKQDLKNVIDAMFKADNEIDSNDIKDLYRLGKYSGIATIEATEAAASVKMLNNRLSRPELWHPRFSTHTLLDNTTVRNKIESMVVVLSRTGTYGDMVPCMVLDHFSAT